MRISEVRLSGGPMSLTVLLLVAVWVSVGAAPASLLPGRPFMAVWNAPTGRCRDAYGVDLDLDPFDIVVNQNQSFSGSEMVIFYQTQLGLYPYYDQEGNPINGGLPQNASLTDHLNAAYKHLVTSIPSPDFEGVAVIDWEDWRPLWDRNWDKKDIYRERSRELVREEHPEWPAEEVLLEAKREFEEAAAKFVTSTLALSRKLRPGGLWGLYGFPGCYNYEYKKGGHNYTGECPPLDVAQNDLLEWMWRSSRALYPSLYLEPMLKGSEYVGPLVKHRVEEAFRVSGQSEEGDLPVFPYARIVYDYSMDFMTEEDLMQTIGQSAALGAAGIILWGNTDYSRSKLTVTCLQYRSLSSCYEFVS
ncbi:PREDICTED: hyaluronidase-1-like [Nanorana parkeri]|uniref:hyaluronidase-1-like n=1 Tax=Nanorana parkeri TaxID=125878 RepID=UPI000854795B|nr:PREDICTED: hyaluronidase-1-like [Nanorana parkeri]